MSYSAEEVKRLRSATGLDQAEFGKELGITREMVSYIENGKKPISEFMELKLDKLKQSLQSKLDTSIPTKFGDDVPNIGKRATGQELRKKKAYGKTEDLGLIYVPIRAQAGYTRNFEDAVYINQLERVYVPDSPYRGDDYRYFEIEGDSMYPTLQDGMHVLCQKVQQESWKSIFDYYIYIIVMEGQILAKRLFKIDDRYLVMISDNEELYPQQKLDIKEVKELWLVKRKLDWNMMAPKNFEIKIK